MPLLIWRVMIEPGTVWPVGDVPTTVPADDVLLTELAWSATWKPVSLIRWRASSWVMPETLGTLDPGAPST